MKTSKASSFFDRSIKPENEFYIDNNLFIVERIYHSLDDLGWSKRDLARKVGVPEEEINGWLSGMHNLSLKQISKMEAVMDRRVLMVE